MFVYKYNEFTKKYYKYDSDNVDLFEPMFDEELHLKRLMTPLVKHPTTCMYCNTEFSSRNQLFHHLGYMNIDIRCAKSTTKCDTDEYSMDMGEFGLEPKPKKRFKIVKPKKHSKATQLLIAELINDLKL